MSVTGTINSIKLNGVEYPAIDGTVAFRGPVRPVMPAQPAQTFTFHMAMTPASARALRKLGMPWKPRRHPRRRARCQTRQRKVGRAMVKRVLAKLRRTSAAYYASLRADVMAGAVPDQTAAMRAALGASERPP